MCRLFAATSDIAVSVSVELLESENSVLRQSEEHDSGWGSAYYEGDAPVIRRFPHAAHADAGFHEATAGSARLIMWHVRRATIGGLRLENTHPFAQGAFTYCHNGTIVKASLLEPLAHRQPRGDTDSERFFNLLMEWMDPDDVIGSLRRTVAAVCERCGFSALNCLLCDGRRMYAYRLGIYELHWLERDLGLDADTATRYHVHVERPAGATLVLVASERLTPGEPWATLGQDELLVCDPGVPGPPRIERLLGPSADGIEFVPVDTSALRGTARGEWAATRAAEGF